MTKLQETMKAAGYLTAQVVADMVGWNISTIYRKHERKELLCVQVGAKWFVSAASLQMHLGTAANVLMKDVEIPEESRVWADAFKTDPYGTLKKLAEMHGGGQTEVHPAEPKKRERKKKPAKRATAR